MKNHNKIYLLIVVISMIAMSFAKANDLSRHHSLSVGITEQAFGTLRINYTYTTRIDPKLLPLSLEGGALFPVFLNRAKKNLKDGSFYVRLGSGISLSKRLLIPIDVTFSLDRQEQSMGKFNAISYNIAICPGVKINDRSFWGIDMEWYEVPAVHIVHSDYSRARFRDRYDGETELEDGWYALTAHRINIGVTHIHDMKTGFRVKLSGGVRLSPSPFNIFFEGGMFGQLPFYMDIRFQIPLWK